MRGEHEERLGEILVRYSSDVITILEADGTIRYDSPAVERVLGCAPGERVGEDAFSYVHADDLEVARTAFGEILGGAGVLGPVELRSRHADGSWRWLEGVVNNLLSDPSVGGIVVNFRDVTERKRAAEERARVAGEYEGIIRALPNLVFRWRKGDDGGVYPAYSEGALAEEFGVTTGRVAGKSLEELFLPGFRETALPAFERAFAGETVEFLTRIGDRTFRNVAMPSGVEGTAPAEEVVGYAIEVTERERAEEALRRSEGSLAEAQRIARLGSWEADFGSGTARWSGEMYRIHGFEPQSFVPTQEVFLGLVHPDDRGAVEAYFRKPPGGAGRDTLECRVVRPDGEVRVVRNHREVRLGEGGEPARLAGTVQDVTELREAERRLREAEERYRTLVEQIPAVTYVDRYVDPASGSDDEPLYVSPQIEGMLGYTPQEWVGEGLWPEKLHPEDRERVLAADARFEAGEEERFGEEYRLFAKDGSVVWVREDAVLVRGEAGEPLFWQGVMLDMTERKMFEEALRGSEERFRSLVQNASDIITVLEADGTVRYESPAVERVLGRKPGDLVGENAFSYVHPEDRRRVLDAFAEGMEDPGIPFGPIEFRFRHADDSWRRLEGTGTNLLHDPAVRGAVVNCRDVTQRKEAEERLREAEERYRTMVEGVPAVTYVARQEPGGASRIAYISPQVGSVLGYTQEEYAADPGFWRSLLHPEDRGRVVAEDARTGETGEPFRDEFRVTAKDGSVVWLREERRIVRVEEDGTQVWHGVMFDVTERKALEEELQHRALHDALTRLPNRALLMDRLRHALGRARRRGGEVAVLFVDLDNFKVINDSLGHQAGDELLVAVAGRLRALLRPEDTVARFGGDEFAFLLEDAGADGAARVAQRVLEELRAPFSAGGREVFATASVGVAVGDAEKRAEDLLREADLAMYRAKRSGKARHAVFEEGMDARALERLELEHDLRRALERDEFVVRYQPIVHLETGETWGVEALVRWNHPERGLLLPDEFVPLAEETGLIVPIGERVLGEACRRAKGWRGSRPSEQPPAVCVNLSARQFREPGLPEDVTRVLAQTGLEPERLFLEVTESAAMEDVLVSAVALEVLQDLGVRVIIDDFGTGYSSLSYLSRFPVDHVKIDHSFVGGLGEEPSAALLAGGVIQLAHALGLTVVAEGVETAGQLERLREMGCDAAQGYYFSDPLPGEAVGALLESRAPR